MSAPNLVVSLFDKTGNMVKPFLDAGRIALIVDIQHPPGLTTDDGRLWRLGCDLRAGFDLPAGLPDFAEIEFISCFPPCDHLAVSGARWFKGKGLRLLALSIDLFATAADFCVRMKARYPRVRYMIENPVSTISTYWREPNYHFHPFQYTGVVATDNYLKNTCLWTSEDYVLPAEQTGGMVAAAVAIVKAKFKRLLAKKSALEKMTQIEVIDGEEIAVRMAGFDVVEQWYPDDRIHDASPGEGRADTRSETPMGFAIANFMANRIEPRRDPEVDLFADAAEEVDLFA